MLLAKCFLTFVAFATMGAFLTTATYVMGGAWFAFPMALLSLGMLWTPFVEFYAIESR